MNNWKCFKDDYPISNCGIIIKIKNDNNIYYGYVFNNSKCIYIILDLSDFTDMAWKVLKDHEKEDIYWYYHSEFSTVFQDSVNNK